MKEKSKQDSDSNKRANTVEDINRKNESQPAQPSNDNKEESYEEQTLMDGVGSSYDDEKRTQLKGNKKAKDKN